MDKKILSESFVDTMVAFISHTAKVLPTDVTQRLKEMATKESMEPAKTIYDVMSRNQNLAYELDRPSCQDTGVLQFWIECGESFPLIGIIPNLLRRAVVRATEEAPLRHNCVETFDEYNTGNNTGRNVPTIIWDIIPDCSDCRIYMYMAGGGASLPGRAKVLMPGEGYEGIAEFVLDTVSDYGVNACPPLLVGIGVGTSVETAALLSKKALLRKVGEPHENKIVAGFEKKLESGLNELGIGPQGLCGAASVMGVHVENAGRHPSTIGVAVNVGCWAHRRGCIEFDSEMRFTSSTHPEVNR